MFDNQPVNLAFEKAMFLNDVRLFEQLPASDIEQIADIALEEIFADDVVVFDNILWERSAALVAHMVTKPLAKC